MTHHPAIVAIGFNRPDSLKRLLVGLSQAQYPPGTQVPLVIAIDFEDSPGHLATAELADKHEWVFGEKRVIVQEKNLGLKSHVLLCGDLTHHYGSIIMFEDDIFPGKNFYGYVIKTLEFYQFDDKVAGVSLYNHRYNFISGLPFDPIYDGYDNYFLQLGASWGQAWTKKQWTSFRNWYAVNNVVSEDTLLPDKIINWSSSSWLKHFDHFMVENDLYFVYPRVAYSTNFSDAGVHVGRSYPHFQTKLESFVRPMGEINLSLSGECGAMYDSFFELLPSILKKSLPEFKNKSFVVDLYGSKPLHKYERTTLFLTSRKLQSGKKSIIEYGMELKPIENNILYNIKGNIFLLAGVSDLEKDSQFKKKSFALDVVEYFYGRLSQKILLRSLMQHVKRKLTE